MALKVCLCTTLPICPSSPINSCISIVVVYILDSAIKYPNSGIEYRLGAYET